MAVAHAAWDGLGEAMKAQEGRITPAKSERMKNGYAGLVAGLSAQFSSEFYSPFAGGGGYQQLSQPETFIGNMAASPFTLQMMALNFGYMTYGLAQTLIDQPVDDAFKGGLIIKIPELKAVDIARLHKRMKRARDIHAMKQAIKWARLFGGAGLIIATDQDSRSELDKDGLGRPGAPLSFLPCDRWELTVPRIATNGFAVPTFYQYYGESLDWSRVIRVMGREAPSRVRSLLQGWGMSELERCIRQIQLYLKLETVIFELVDEAKIDVYRLEELNAMLDSADGTQAAILRIMIANLIKNYKNAVVLDKEDEYEQKTMQFGGLGDLLEQCRINLAGALRIPLNKLFGQSATGFASGEDAMENYNALVESDVREPAGPMIDEVISLRCIQEFGYVPDFTAEFHPLRIVDPVSEESIKASKQKRVIELRQADQITGKEADDILHQEGLLSINTEVGAGVREPMAAWTQQADDQGEEGDDDVAGTSKVKNARPSSNEDTRRKYEWLTEEARRGRLGGWFKRQMGRASDSKKSA